MVKPMKLVASNKEFKIFETFTGIHLVPATCTEKSFADEKFEPLISVKLDTHDNRLTTVISQQQLVRIKDDEGTTASQAKQQRAVEFLAEYLQTFGGKQFVMCDTLTAAMFKQCGFTTQDPTPSKQFRVTSPQNLQQSADFPGFTAQQIHNPKKYFARILELMQLCGFTKEKMADYRNKGNAGIQVMCDNSNVYGLFNHEQVLVGLCRVADIGTNHLGQKLLYLGDSLVDPKYFNPHTSVTEFGEPKESTDEATLRAHATKVLYHEVSKQIQNYQQVSLLAPRGREKEFDINFKCIAPAISDTEAKLASSDAIAAGTMLFRFGPATPKLGEALTSHAKTIETVTAKKIAAAKNTRTSLGVIAGGIAALVVFSKFFRAAKQSGTTEQAASTVTQLGVSTKLQP